MTRISALDSLAYLFRCVVVLAATVASPAQTGYPYVIGTLAGSSSASDSGPATSALLQAPAALTVDSAGNLYIADNGNIRVVAPSGTISTYSSKISATDLKVDGAGTVFASDGYASILKITRTGITTVAGGSYGFGGDGSSATSAKLASPHGFALDRAGNLFIADTANQRVRKVTPDGRIQTIAGTGVAGKGPEDVPATTSALDNPYSVAVDSAGALYVSEWFRIRRIDSSGIITTIAGNGNSYSLSGLAISAGVGAYASLAFDASDNLYVADYPANYVRMIRPDGTIVALAGISISGTVPPDFSGFALFATFKFLSAVAVASEGSVFVADLQGQQVWRIDSSHISLVAGGPHFAGDGGQAAKALLNSPQHVIADSAGNLYISDTNNHRIRKVAPDGTINTIAGTGDCQYNGDSIPANTAALCWPTGLALDRSGNLYVADLGNRRVRQIDRTGLIRTFAGDGSFGDSSVTGDGGPASSARLQSPYGLAFDSSGNLYISENGAARVRVVLASGTIMTFAGTGSSGFSGDGGPATAARLSGPGELFADSSGRLYIADRYNYRVRRVSSGTITTVAGIGTCCASGPNAANTWIGTPGGMTMDAAGDLFVAQSGAANSPANQTAPGQEVVFRISSTGSITRIAGGGSPAVGIGDGGLATDASLSTPAGLWLDSSGDLLVADSNHNLIRKLTLNSPSSLTIAGGDAQTGAVGAILPNDLSVAVGFRAGLKLSGVPVGFSVTSGSATLSAASAPTDNSGVAKVTVTLGNATGPVEISASIAGVAPVRFHLTATPPATPVPVISVGGITGAGGSVPPVNRISPGALVTAYGSNFAPPGTARSVQSTDLVNGSLPNVLDGVCVRVGETPAFMTFVSPGQVNFEVPTVPVTGNVDIRVVVNCGAQNELRSSPVAVPVGAATPEFLYWIKNPDGRNPVIAVNSVTGAYAGPSGAVPGLTLLPAKPGDILTIYVISAGPTAPPVAPGASAAGAARVDGAAVFLDGISLDSAAILYAGASPGTAGLYQLNIQVPPLTDGDHPIVLRVGESSTPTGAFLTIRN